MKLQVRIEELRARAEEQAKELPPPASGALESLRSDATQFFARVPEPPVYRRRDDPAKARAEALVQEGLVLLARAVALQGKEDAELWRAALDAHLDALCLIGSGRVEAADTTWHQALQLERKATAPRRLFRRTDEARPPVFDRASRASRYDPRPEAAVQAKLPCPGCRKIGEFALAQGHATHAVRCASCNSVFSVYLAEARACEVTKTPGRNHYRFHLEELAGVTSRLEADDLGHDELLVTRGDLMAFLYAPPGTLRGILNLDTSRVLWLASPGLCFVATVAFGEGAPELDVLRCFRDRTLLASAPGRAFVRWYYRDGPALARIVERTPWLRPLVKTSLRAVVYTLERARP
jgi:hypothetical protein